MAVIINLTTMKNLISFTCLSLFLMVIIAGCGPSEEEQQQREQARQDSLEQARQDSVQRVQQQRQDSLKQVRADSMAKAEQEQTAGVSGVTFTEEGSFSVQVASWRSQYKAEQQAKMWRERGFSNANVVQYGNEQAGNVWFRVRVGRVETREEAKQLVQQLQEEYQTKAWIASAN